MDFASLLCPKFSLILVISLLHYSLDITSSENASTESSIAASAGSGDCLARDVERCMEDFFSLYADETDRNGSPTDVEKLKHSLQCWDHLPAGQSCGAVDIEPNCNVSQSEYTSVNYGMVCTTSGLKIYSWTSSNCELISRINASMDAFCRFLNCSQSGVDDDGNWVFTMTKSDVLSPVLKNCSSTATTTPHAVPLMENPIGPEAITAVVVLVCLSITAILAGFFFWPKCHIADPAAYAEKMAARSAAAINQRGQGPVQVMYDNSKQIATVQIPPTLGPSAA